MRVSSKGQVTIPRELRELTGIRTNSDVVFSIENGKLILMPKDGMKETADSTHLNAFLDTLTRLEGTGDRDIHSSTLMSMTRDR